ncbi:carbamoyl transferase [bacterium]|nr:carbamoyl transferase [bacterium]
MNILGFNYLGHDASASLLCNGKLVAAIEEERFTRNKKHYGGFPFRSISFCLKKAGIDANQINIFSFYIKPEDLMNYTAWKFVLSPWYSIRNKILFASRALLYYNALTMRSRLKKHFPYLKKGINLSFVRHHDAHMASAFFVSPFTEADIISIDGIGEWETTVIGQGKDNMITRIQSHCFPDSIGYLYSAITRFLGFRVNNDEYKVMGLASYGDPEKYKKLFEKIVYFKEHGIYRINPQYIALSHKWGNISKHFIHESGLLPRKPESDISQDHKDIAASLQSITEKVGIHIAQDLQKRTKSKKLCLSGGVALNCVMNAKILENTSYDDIYIQPASYDASCSLGCALWINHINYKQPRNYEMNHVYYGYEADDQEILSTLKKYENITFRKCENIARDTAAEMAKQRIIGWYQGKMEWGPRALGNRSILADPRQRKMMDIINDRIKHREDFRPFAPSCKIENYREYFNFPVPSPFMLLICNVKEEKRSVIPAVTHVDGTARFHTVEKKHNPLYWELIHEFEKLTGVPVVLNTSFNVRGETIVMTPEDAINCFLGTGIDALAIGNYFVEKNNL